MVIKARRLKGLGFQLTNPHIVLFISIFFLIISCTQEQKAERLIRKLDSMGPRLKPFNELVAMGSPAVPPLIRSLKNDNTIIRKYATQILGEIGDPRAVKPLSEVLRTTDKPSARFAAKALGKIGDPKAVPALVASLEDQDDRVRENAAEALGLIGDVRALLPLHARSSVETDYSTKEEISKALNVIAGRGLRSDADIIFAVANMHRHRVFPLLLEKSGEASVLPLIEALSQEPPPSIMICDMLGQIGDKRAVQPILEVLVCDHAPSRAKAAEVLGLLNDQQAVSGLIKAVADNDPTVRSAASKSLGELGDPQAVSALIKAVADVDPQVRSAAAESLGKLGDHDAVLVLGNAIDDTEKNVRLSAIRSLGYIGGMQAVPALIDALKHFDSSTQWGATDALSNIGEAAIDPLITQLKILKPKPEDMMSYVSKALENIGEPAVPKLLSLLKSNSASIRIRSAAILAEIDSTEAVDAIRSGYEAGDNSIIVGAHTYFVKQSDPDSIPKLIQALNAQGTDKMADTLLNCGDQRLQEAALAWAQRNGYWIMEWPSLESGAKWKKKK